MTWALERRLKLFSKALSRRQMHYVIYKDSMGQWRWNLRDSNEYLIAVSGDGYPNKAECQRSIDFVKASGNAPVYDRKAPGLYASVRSDIERW